MDPQRNRIVTKRRAVNAVVLTAAVGATLLALFWLVWILGTTLVHGAQALDARLFVEMTPPPGQPGGLLNAFYGSLLMVGLAVLIGTPIGILAGTFLAEVARYSWVSGLIRFLNDILLSTPSIIVGLFVYELVVRPTRHFSGWAGAVALALILLPVVVRTSDEMLQLVPAGLREAGLSLGLPHWVVTTRIVYRAAGAGILTGVLLGVARISGETAPLLFTALNNQFWNADPAHPMANIPVVIFQYAMSPYEEWHALAWAGSFVMVAFVLILGLVSRKLLARRTHVA